LFRPGFDDEDQDRLRTQIAGSISDGKSSAVMALHVAWS
jgi:hypothetical protein